MLWLRKNKAVYQQCIFLSVGSSQRLTILFSMWCLAIWKRLFETYNFPRVVILSGFPLRQTSARLKPRHSPCRRFVRKQTNGLFGIQWELYFSRFQWKTHEQTDTTKSLRLRKPCNPVFQCCFYRCKTAGCHKHCAHWITLITQLNKSTIISNYL